jgi:hypothetical protein
MRKSHPKMPGNIRIKTKRPQISESGLGGIQLTAISSNFFTAQPPAQQSCRE